MIANHKGEIPFVILLIPFILGIIFGLNFGRVAYDVPVIISTTVLCALFTGLNITYKWFHIYKSRWVGGLLFNAILFLFGWIAVTNYSELNRADHFSKTIAKYLVVNISNEPVLKNGYLRFNADVKESVNQEVKTVTSGTLLISLKDTTANAKALYYGDELLIPANYKVIDPPFNPAEFNYKQYLAHKNIYYQSFLYQGSFKLIGHDVGNTIVAYSLRLRQNLVTKLKANMHDHDAIAVASALLLGYRADLSDDVLQAYSKTGTIYVLTVSGSQVAVIYFLLSYVLSFLNRHKYGKLLKAVLIIIAIWYYALLTGLSPAVCRAVVVVSFVVIGRTYDRYINTLNLLAASAFVLFLYDPFMITEVGFQLGYIAVSGLIILRPIVYKWFKFKNSWTNKVWNVCSVSIAAQIITFPLSAFYFHQFPVYFLVGNLLAIIPVMVIMYTGIIYLLLPQIAFISKWLGYILEKTILLLNKMLALFQHVPLANIDKIWINTVEYLLLYTIILTLFYYLYFRKGWLLISCLTCVLLLIISISLKKIGIEQSNSIAFLNMRKHVGIVMKNGTSAIVISDLADTDKNYRYSVQPYLDSCGITSESTYNLTQNINSAFAMKKYQLLQFREKRILICDGKINDMVIDPDLKPDYIYLAGNPYTAINSIDGKHVGPALVIDAGNSDHFISTIKKQADSLGIKYCVLKRNKSLIAASN